MPAWIPIRRPLFELAPGVVLCIVVAALSLAISEVQNRLIGSIPIDSYVGAILVGACLRTARDPDRRIVPGIRFSAKVPLEAGVALLGASISIDAVELLSPTFVLAIGALVAVAVIGSYAFGRVVGLSNKLAVMVACGNSICGNSAIAAVAPIIDANPEDMAAAVAFTAIWGTPIVIALPWAAFWLGLRPEQLGTFAGLTVYSVPQVLAATLPVGVIAAQVGTLTKLVRIVMLAPVIYGVSMIFRSRTASALSGQLVPPWFIIAFFVLVSLRSAGWIPDPAVAPIASVSNALTLLAMAALGLSTDTKLLVRSSGRITAATLGSMGLLGVLAVGVVMLK